MNTRILSVSAFVFSLFCLCLPAGAQTGKKWLDMNYGPYFSGSVEAPGPDRNLTYKGLILRVDGDWSSAAGSADSATMLFDTDLLRFSAGWTGGLLNMRNISWDGSHGTHSTIKGDPVFLNPRSPGWARPGDGSFKDPRELPYGPLPKKWAHFKGLYLNKDQVILSYSVGNANLLELASFRDIAGGKEMSRTLNIKDADRELVLLACARGGEPLSLLERGSLKTGAGPARSTLVLLGRRAKPKTAVKEPPPAPKDITEGLLGRWSFNSGSGKTVSNLAGKTLTAIVHGARREKGYEGQGLRFDGRSRLDIPDGGKINLGGRDYSISAWVKTRSGGTILAKTGPKWEEQGKTFFIREGRLGFDIGWVGQVAGDRRVTDGKWHHVAMTFQTSGNTIRFYVDGKADGAGRLEAGSDVRGHILRSGFTSPEFPNPSGFNGSIDELRLYGRKLGADEIATLAGKPGAADDSGEVTLVSLSSSGKGLSARWQPEASQLRLKLSPAPGKARDRLKLSIWKGPAANLEKYAAGLDAAAQPSDLAPLTKGGPARWKEKLRTECKPGADRGGFAVDILTVPMNNPWKSWMRLGGFDFFADGRRAAACTWMGDVWLIEGLGGELGKLSWQRIASGLFQPLGLKIVDETIYVLGRDQITILRDLNGDGETDHYENFNNDAECTEHFHEFAMDLQTDAQGNFYYTKGGRHAKDSVVPQHGSIIRVSKDGSKTEIIANGFRAPNGLCVNPDGTFFTSDQEGHWTPANRINWVKKDGFYGYMWSFHRGKKPTSYDPPLCWLHPRYDRSPAEQLWVPKGSWGPLGGRLISLSYGTGAISHILHEKVGGLLQGGATKLDIPIFPTGIMRGRFHPGDGHLYLCGLFGWAGNRTQAGGLYRIRHTGKALHLPLDLHATERGLVLTFSDPLEPERAKKTGSYSIERWNYLWRQQYGSKDYKLSDGKIGRDKVAVKSAAVSKDGRSVFLEIEDMQPCMQMLIRYRLSGADGAKISQEIYNTIHKLGDHSKVAAPFD